MIHLISLNYMKKDFNQKLHDFKEDIDISFIFFDIRIKFYKKDPIKKEITCIMMYIILKK